MLHVYGFIVVILRHCFVGDCLAGYYCTSRANNSAPTDGVMGDFCPEGNYCPVGTPAPIPCNDGKSNNLTFNTLAG